MDRANLVVPREIWQARGTTAQRRPTIPKSVAQLSSSRDRNTALAMDMLPPATVPMRAVLKNMKEVQCAEPANVRRKL